MKYLIVGLGNIGAEYADTRHNIGFRVLDALAEASNVSFTAGRYGSTATLRYRGRTVILLKPSTYMNLSGKAVRYWLEQENIPIENLLVISDDIALPFGELRMRKKGSAGGHNGLKNIAELLGREIGPACVSVSGATSHAAGRSITFWAIGPTRACRNARTAEAFLGCGVVVRGRRPRPYDERLQ